MSREDSFESSGWPEFFDEGVLLTQRGKTGWREIEIGRGSSERTCPVAAGLKFARIARKPTFRAVLAREVGPEQLNDRHVARAVKRLAIAAGVRGDVSEREREEKFAGHSLRAGLASSAVAKHLKLQQRFPIKSLAVHLICNTAPKPATKSGFAAPYMRQSDMET
jgi:hypothetical protein